MLDAAGIPYLVADELQARREVAIQAPVAGFGRAGSSTWQSLARGQTQVETDYLNGEIVLLGRLHGVPTPANVYMQHLLVRMARAGMQPGSVDVEKVLAALGVDR